MSPVMSARPATGAWFSRLFLTYLGYLQFPGNIVGYDGDLIFACLLEQLEATACATQFGETAYVVTRRAFVKAHFKNGQRWHVAAYTPVEHPWSVCRKHSRSPVTLSFKSYAVGVRSRCCTALHGEQANNQLAISISCKHDPAPNRRGKLLQDRAHNTFLLMVPERVANNTYKP